MKKIGILIVLSVIIPFGWVCFAADQSLEEMKAQIRSQVKQDMSGDSSFRQAPNRSLSPEEQLKEEARAQVRQEMGITKPKPAADTSGKTVKNKKIPDVKQTARNFVRVLEGLGLTTFDADGIIKWLSIMLILGLIPAFLARSKGYNFFIWWIMGIFFFIVALPVTLFLGKKIDDKKEAKPKIEKPVENAQKNGVASFSDTRLEKEHTASSAEKSSPPLVIFDIIEKMKLLRDSGVITQEEFELKKKDWLSKI